MDFSMCHGFPPKPPKAVLPGQFCSQLGTQKIALRLSAADQQEGRAMDQAQFCQGHLVGSGGEKRWGGRYHKNDSHVQLQDFLEMVTWCDLSTFMTYVVFSTSRF